MSGTRGDGVGRVSGWVAFVGTLLAIGAYPIWSVVLLVVDALILWAVTVHSDEFV